MPKDINWVCHRIGNPLFCDSSSFSRFKKGNLGDPWGSHCTILVVNNPSSLRPHSVVSPLGELSPLRVMAVIASPAAWPRPSAAPFAACPATAATAQIYQIHHRLPGPCWISWRIWRKHMGPSRKNTFKIIYERHILNKTASKFGTSKNTRYKSYQIITILPSVPKHRWAPNSAARATLNSATVAAD